tara:strand:- start:1050 stop:2654 length:1605 start_codon:yes stop_codon:yes gene_type:complete
MKYLDPRNSGLICFKGDGASSSEVEAIVDDKVEPLVTAGTEISNTIGTPTEGGVVQATGGVMSLPTTVTNPETGEVTAGTPKEVTYGGGDVAVTPTIKGDTENLLAGQSDISGQITSGFENFQPVNVTNTTIDTSNLAKADAMNTGFTNVLKDTGSIKTGVENLGTTTDLIQTGVGDIQTTLGGEDGKGGLMGDVSQLGTDLGVTADSGSVTSQLQGIGNNITNLGSSELDQSQIGTRFDSVDSALATADQNATKAFERLMGTPDSELGGVLGDIKQKVLAGQLSVKQVVDEIKKNQAQNQVDNAASLGTLITGQETAATNFGDFTKQYTTDTNLANTARADLQKQITGGVSTLQGNIAGATGTLRNQVANQGANAQEVATAESKNYAQIMRDLNDVSKAVDSNNATDVLSRLDTIRNVLNAQGVNIDENIRRQYADLANAFDKTGRLITQSVDNQGNVIRRGMDDQNNLLIATFDANGKILGQTTRDINQLLAQMDSLGYQQRGGQFGDLSTSGLGLMSGEQNAQPFIQQAIT